MGFRSPAADSGEREASLGRERAEARLVNLQNVFAAAQLIQDPEQRLAAEKKAQQAIIGFYKEKVATLKKHRAGILAIRQAETDVIAARLTLQTLKKTAKTGGGGFTLQELFAEAGSELATYGGNVAARGTPLSPQGARASRAGTVKSSYTTVVQNFWGERGTAQALNEARASARNLR